MQNEALVILLGGVPANHGINDLVDFLCSFCLGAKAGFEEMVKVVGVQQLGGVEVASVVETG